MVTVSFSKYTFFLCRPFKTEITTVFCKLSCTEHSDCLVYVPIIFDKNFLLLTHSQLGTAGYRL